MALLYGRAGRLTAAENGGFGPGQYASCHGGGFATEISALLNATLCNLDLGTSDTCDLSAPSRGV